MLKPEVENSRLRDVVEFEVNFIRESYEKEIAEKDNVIAEKDSAIAERDSAIVEKDAEIDLLKAKLNENGIEY